MERHDPIFGKRNRRILVNLHTGDKHGLLGDEGPFCKCMDCAQKREERWNREHKETLADLCADLDPVILRDANAQKVVRKLTDEITDILNEYDEADSIWGERILNKLRNYHRAS